MINYNDISLLDIMPDNLLEDSNVKAAAKAIDSELKKVANLCKETILIARIDELSEDVIDLLAWQWQAYPLTDIVLDLQTKRTLVKQSIKHHRTRGTPAAVSTYLNTVFKSGQVEEWFNYDGEPYHFKVNGMASETPDMDKLNEIVRVINIIKNARSWLDGISFERKINDVINIGTVVSSHKTIEISPAIPRGATLDTTQYISGMIDSHKTVEIRQAQPIHTSVNSSRYIGAIVNTHKTHLINEKET